MKPLVIVTSRLPPFQVDVGAREQGVARDSGELHVWRNGLGDPEIRRRRRRRTLELAFVERRQCLDESTDLFRGQCRRRRISPAPPIVIWMVAFASAIACDT